MVAADCRPGSVVAADPNGRIPTDGALSERALPAWLDRAYSGQALTQLVKAALELSWCTGQRQPLTTGSATPTLHLDLA